MRFECDRDIIKNKISLVEKITGKNTNHPALQNILLVVDGKTLIISGTNLEVGIEVKIPIYSGKDGFLCVSGGLFNSFINSIPNNTKIKAAVAENNLLVSTENYSALLKTFPHDSVPKIEHLSKKTEKTIPIKTITDGLKSVLFSVSLSDVKPEIASVFVYQNNNNLFFVATDSFRLSEKKLNNNSFFEEKILIPGKNATEIIRFLEGGDESVVLCCDGSRLSVETNDTYLVTRLTDGVYPDYTQIIPTRWATEVVVGSKEVLNAIKNIALFADEFQRINLRVFPDDGAFEVSSKNQNKGEGTVRINAEISGPAVDMSFNAKYLEDVFRVVGTDMVSFRFNESHKPLLISPVGDQTFTYIVMPVTR